MLPRCTGGEAPGGPRLQDRVKLRLRGYCEGYCKSFEDNAKRLTRKVTVRVALKGIYMGYNNVFMGFGRLRLQGWWFFGLWVLGGLSLRSRIEGLAVKP